MAKGVRKCKICGCEYPYCKSEAKGRFVYQNVACCPEHGAEYFRLIELSRMHKPAQSTDDAKNEINLNENIDKYDALFEEEYEDNDDDIELEI